MEMIDAREFAEWRALYQIKPWGDDWAQADLIAWASLGGPPNTKPGTFLPAGFPIGVRPSSDYPSTEELIARMNAWAAGSGIVEGSPSGTVNR